MWHEYECDLYVFYFGMHIKYIFLILYLIFDIISDVDAFLNQYSQLRFILLEYIKYICIKYSQLIFMFTFTWKYFCFSEIHSFSFVVGNLVCTVEILYLQWNFSLKTESHLFVCVLSVCIFWDSTLFSVSFLILNVI